MTDKRHIVFVDDEPLVLAALRRLTHARRGAWTCHFADGGEAALGLLQSVSADVIVTDMRMPGIDGAELLRRVKEIQPHTVRIILSGYSEEESILRAIGPAHQYLAKPCDQATLEATIDRALGLRAILNRPALLDLVGSLDSLPSPADHHLRLMRRLEDPTASCEAVASLVGQDIGMLAELLRVTNSQYFALTRPAATADQAIRFLGVETVRLLVLRMGLFRMFSGSPAVADTIAAIETRALQMATAARRDAVAAGLSPAQADEMACAGMLWEIGLLALLDRWPTRLLQILTATSAEGRDLGAALTEELGASHFEVGGYLLGLWGFRTTVVEAVTLLADVGQDVPARDARLGLLRRCAAAVDIPLR
ncbi:MAG: HDOD domain-containing protein [Caenispirillum sp.]|nr:HDOD domain-containing protein [Caenispirillum sp.]